jgi:hypothetical protein
MTRICQGRASAAAIAVISSAVIIGSLLAAPAFAGETSRCAMPSHVHERAEAENFEHRAARSDEVRPANVPDAPDGAAADHELSNIKKPDKAIEIFLDRLMAPESGGRYYARNPRSTALGPYQFIASTWLELARSAFAEENAELKPHEVLDLRTDLAFARRAAKIYTQANAQHLIANGYRSTFGNLRLAFLVGPAGAVRVLAAKSVTPVSAILGRTVVGANPYMRAITAREIERATRDVSYGLSGDASIAPIDADPNRAKRTSTSEVPKVRVRCNLSLPSCRRWLALAKRRANHGFMGASRE